MNPTRVWAKNFRTYPTLDWSPQSGLTTILGRNTLGDGADSNGAGKSTVLEALFVALFGPSLPWDQYITVGSEESTCEVGCEFQHGLDTYRVRRTYSALGRGKTTCDLECLSNDPLGAGPAKSLTMGKQDETQALITSLIGLSEEAFVHSVYSPQGHPHFADARIPPRQKKDILSSALGLGIWDELKALVGKDILEIKNALEAIVQRLGAFEDDLARQPELEAAHGVYIATAERAALDLSSAEASEAKARANHVDAKSAAERAATLEANRNTAVAALTHLTEKATAAESAAAKAEQARADIAALTPLASRLESLEAEQKRIANLDLERSAIVTRKESLTASIAALDEMIASKRSDIEAARTEAKHAREREADAICPTCEQTLHGAALAKARANVERDAGRFDRRAEEIAVQLRAFIAESGSLREEAAAIIVPAEIPITEVASIQKDLQDAREAQTALTRATATLDSLQTALPPSEAEMAAGRAALAEAEQALAAVTVLDTDALGLLAREADRASTHLASCRAADRTAQTELATSEERLRSLAALAERAQESLAERERLNARLDVLKALERSYGRDGIPALRLEVQAIPQIEAEARRVLEALGMPFRVELATQRENKGGGIKDTLDVVVHEPAGARSYATYSGGERTRLEVALRLGIARLIAQRSSSACSLLALDELPWLDRSGQAALVEVLRGLTEFEKVVLVSHDEVLADSFDQALLVVRDEEGSRIEVAA